MQRTLDLTGPGSPKCRFTSGREIIVIDGLLTHDQIATACGAFSKLSFSLCDVDGEDTKYARHWKAEWPAKRVAAIDFFRLVEETVGRIYGAYQLELVRVHCNLHMYGDLQFPHVDCSEHEGVTALYFANATWEREWMGETIFYDSSGDAEYAVAVKPGRLLIFDGNILHRGGVPNRECFEPRLSVAFKYRIHQRDRA
jgi:hypothetical protein